MDPLVTTAHTAIIIVATTVAMVVFLSLAIYVASQNLYRPTAWLFSLACLLIAGVYFISFFTVSGSKTSLLLFLRLRWVAIIFGPTLFLHLIFFYFPLTWQRYRLQILLSIYSISFIMATMTLLTDQVIAAPMPQHAPHIAMPMPGPLMPYIVAFIILEVLTIAFGFAQSYRHTSSLSLRRQLGFLILPTGIIFVASAMHSFNIFIGDTSAVPHEIPDALLIIAAFLYLKAAIHYGAFIGHPLTWRHLFYAGLWGGGGLAALYLTSILDRWLMRYSYFPYPLATTILVVTAVACFPAANHWLLPRLDSWLFRRERQQQALTHHLASTLIAQSDLERLLATLLETLCLLLDVRSGFVATVSSPETLTVRAVRSHFTLQSGDNVPAPLSVSLLKEARLLLPADVAQQSESIWTAMTLLCPLQVAGIEGLLTLGERRDGTPFTAQDINLCTELVQQLDRWPVDRFLSSYNPSSPAPIQDQAPHGETLVTAAFQSLSVPAKKTAPAIEIRLLGPLQIMRDGQLIPESAWGSEKAKLMLAYLVWKGSAGATREELSDLLWPDRSLEETANVFHVTLHRLRRVFQPKTKNKNKVNYILYDRSRYRFNSAAPHWLDIAQFDELIHSPDLTDQQMAIELYRGAYLEDIAWGFPCDIEVERRRLEQLYADGLRRLAAQSDARQATLYLEKLLAVEPADEAARRTLILTYLAQGREDLVRRHLDYWQRILAELGLEPLPETVAFWKTIQAKAVYGLNGFTN